MLGGVPSFAPAFKQFWRLAIFNCKKVYWGQSSVPEVILVYCGVVVPPIYNTRSWQTFTELCCLVCQQDFASKVLQRRYRCFKTLSIDMWKKRLMWAGVGVGVGVDFSKPESESESESLNFGRLRSPGCHTPGFINKGPPWTLWDRYTERNPKHRDHTYVEMPNLSQR